MQLNKLDALLRHEVAAPAGAARVPAAKLDDPPQVLPVLRGLLNYHLGRGNLAKAHNAAAELLSVGHQHEEANALAFAPGLLGMSFTMGGQLVRAQRLVGIG